MGSSPSCSIEQQEKLFSLTSQHGFKPDIGIDKALENYSGLNSTAVLEDSVSTLLDDMALSAPDYVQSLGSALAGFQGVPNAVGLGALVVSLLLDIVIRASTVESRDNTVDMVRRVFAEEKALGVRDTMEEYLKRLGMHLRDQPKALQETERLEMQLSEQLTRLKNSMLYDGQMNTRAMKIWTNGAAFHSQMLIHMTRLKKLNRSEIPKSVFSISTVVNRYILDLQALLEEYKTFKKGSIVTDKEYRPVPGYYVVSFIREMVIKDTERGLDISNVGDILSECARTEEYFTYMFDNWNIKKQLNDYFSILKKNIETLIVQHDDFTTENVLSRSGSNG